MKKIVNDYIEVSDRAYWEYVDKCREKHPYCEYDSPFFHECFIVGFIEGIGYEKIITKFGMRQQRYNFQKQLDTVTRCYVLSLSIIILSYILLSIL